MAQQPKLYLLLAAFFLLPVICFSQPLELKVTTFDEDKGLNSRLIRCMLQDSAGYFWAGTVDGLSRFDGYNFKTFRNDPSNQYSIAGNAVTALAEDQQHLIWAGLQRGGISCYDPVTGRFRNYPLRSSSGESLSNFAITMIHVDQDNEVWAGIQTKGLAHLNKKTGMIELFDIVAPSNDFYPADQRPNYNQVYNLLPDGTNAFWMATHDGLYHFDKKNKKMMAIREKPLEKGKFRRDLFNTMLKDSVTLWLGSWAGGLSSYNTITGEWNTYLMDTVKKDISTVNIVSGIAEKGKTMIWITSNDKGFGMFNKITRTFFFFGNDNDHMTVTLPSDLCFGLMQDREGGVWVSSEKGLLRIQMHQKKFPFREVPVTHSDNGEYYEISSVLDIGDFILTGVVYGDGLQVTNKKTEITKAIPIEVLPGEEKFQLVTDVYRDSKGIIWVLTRDIIYQFNPVTQRLIKTSQPPLINGIQSNFFNNILEDKQGNLWITTRRNGVFRYNTSDHSFTSFNSRNEEGKSISSNFITSITLDHNGRIWIGGPRGCLAYFDAIKDRFIAINTLKDNNGIDNNQVHSLATDSKGNIWVGTMGGLCMFDPAQTPLLRKIYTAKDGLRADLARSVCEDQYGKIWCITPSALCMIDPATGNISSFGIPDGLRFSAIGERLMRSADNKMIIAAWKGYHVFNPAALEVKRSTASLDITSFTTNGKERHINEQLEKYGRIQLSAEENLFTFEFAAIGFNEANRQQYSYMLEGVDKEWIQSGSRRFANYSNLPGGDYTFKVRATNIIGDWSGPVLSIPVHVATKFYKTWWFRAGLTLLLIAFLVIVYNSRIRQREKVHTLQNKANSLEKEKAQVMYENLKQQLNPHFLFNSLTSLSSLIRINSKMASEFLDSLSKTYRYILKSRDNETVPLINELKFAETYVKLQQTRFEKGLIVNINVPEEYHAGKIAPVTLQNMIENAIKHNMLDEESPLVIDIYAKDDYIFIRNNLQKKNFVETSNKQGLINLQTLYRYLSDRPVEITEATDYFMVKIPLL